MKPCRGFDPGSNPGRGATNSRLPTSFLLLRALWVLLLPRILVPNLMICGLGVYGNNLSFENFLCYIQVLSTFLTLVLGVLMER